MVGLFHQCSNTRADLYLGLHGNWLKVSSCLCIDETAQEPIFIIAESSIQPVFIVLFNH